jgi:hypothetical protein
MAARVRRLTRFLCTALPTALETTTANLGTSEGRKWIVNRGLDTLLPRFTTSRISSPELKRLPRGSRVAPRRLVRCDPCGGARSKLHDLRGCACVDGNRGSLHDDGYSAGMCACSLYKLPESFGPNAQDNLSTLRHLGFCSQEPILDHLFPLMNSHKKNKDTPSGFDICQRIQLNVPIGELGHRVKVFHRT